MTIREAWELIQNNIQGDCGPYDESWKSKELEKAIEIVEAMIEVYLDEDV